MCPKADAKQFRDKRSDAAVSKANILKALAHPDRIRIFESLSTGEKTVGEIVDMLGAKPAMTSRHLAVLRNAGLVETRKVGLNVYYANKMPCLISMLACVEQAVCAIADEHGKVAACLKPR
jgi:ArsR family transcriptional regulator, arsenate/arsenite/antimonite-responsive transcriptional repressor